MPRSAVPLPNDVATMARSAVRVAAPAASCPSRHRLVIGIIVAQRPTVHEDDLRMKTGFVGRSTSHRGRVRMNVVLSRKGFDSGAGGHASPILPDGTMVSLPIPSPLDALDYADVATGRAAAAERAPDHRIE